MANGVGTKSLWNAVQLGAGFAIGVIIVNGALNMVRRFTGFPPSEFSL
jgi:hypothetical protein